MGPCVSECAQEHHWEILFACSKCHLPRFFSAAKSTQEKAFGWFECPGRLLVSVWMLTVVSKRALGPHRRMCRRLGVPWQGKEWGRQRTWSWETVLSLWCFWGQRAVCESAHLWASTWAALWNRGASRPLQTRSPQLSYEFTLQPRRSEKGRKTWPLKWDFCSPAQPQGQTPRRLAPDRRPEWWRS